MPCLPPACGSQVRQADVTLTKYDRNIVGHSRRIWINLGTRIAGMTLPTLWE